MRSTRPQTGVVEFGGIGTVRVARESDAWPEPQIPGRYL
jgi:hypothetical protein